MVVATVMAAAVVVIKCASAATTETTTADVTAVDTGMIMMIRIKTRTAEKGPGGVLHHRPLTTAVQGTWLAHLPEMRTTSDSEQRALGMFDPQAPHTKKVRGRRQLTVTCRACPE